MKHTGNQLNKVIENSKYLNASDEYYFYNYNPTSQDDYTYHTMTDNTAQSLQDTLKKKTPRSRNVSLSMKKLIFLKQNFEKIQIIY